MTRLLFVLLAGIATVSAQTSLPPLPAPQSVPEPGPETDQPYAPRALMPGGVVVPLYPPNSPYLRADKIREPEQYIFWGPTGEVGAVIHIHNPSIEFHPGQGDLNTGACIILAAGGGHKTLNVGPEGAEAVNFFYNYGISTVILRNRLRSDGYEPTVDGVNDALQAIKLVRAHAKEWHLDPHKIGIMGFSAGAELAAAASLFSHDFDRQNDVPGNPLAAVSSRPDFVGIIYPGPSPFAGGHTVAIPRDMPPVFFTCAGWGDPIHAIWATDFFTALLHDGVPNVEMHIYARGHHPGDKLPPGEPPSTGGMTDRGFIAYGEWPRRFLDWFRDLGYFGKAGAETQADKDVAANLHRVRRRGTFPPMVRIADGALRGVAVDGGAAYLGIPYAAPPVGALRWHEPMPALPWDGLRDATHSGPPAAQADYGWNHAMAAASREDCLYLDVWTPRLQGTARLPVMVWLHGGANAAGSGGFDPLYNGGPLIRHGVILVVVEYRLGIFGFLAHPELTAESPHHASGDYGLQDQLAALRWVQANIAAFGGDPRQVTLFGQSAGGIDTAALMTSPLSRGLFAQAIDESGPLAKVERTPSLADAERAGSDFAKELGAPAGNAIAYLRSLPVQQLLAAKTNPVTLSVDNWVLPVPPAAVFARHGEAPVPFILGWMAAEEEPWWQAQLTTMAEDHSACGCPTWVYAFDHPIPGQPQAHHSGDLPYVFGNYPTTGNLKGDYGPTDQTLSAAVQAYWTAFAHTGQPDAASQPHWPRFDPATRQVFAFQ